MTLTGEPLLVLAVTLAVLGPVALTVWWRRARPRTWLGMASRFGAVLLCQILAVGGLFLWVNNQFGFYTSWSDLLGQADRGAAITSNGLLHPGQGRMQIVTISGGAGANGRHQVLVWLPPQYDQAQFRNVRFPVVMVLPGQPSTPQAMFKHYSFASAATSEIAARHVRPFIAIFPPLMTSPPRDTECTNVPGGPQAESWLSHDVYQGIQNQLRVSASPWMIMGWSTGAFCSAKLLLQHPGQYQAAVGFGGYYAPITDRTTGRLFRSKSAIRENSPMWLYQHGGLHQRKLLLVVGRQDRESYKPTQQLLTASAGDPDVSSLIFRTGGHNYRNYRAYLPTALRWLGTNAHGMGAV